MIFNFLKYIKPTWYFNLRPSQDFAYFPTDELLRNYGFNIEIDRAYKSLESQKRDLAWRAFQRGFISKTNEKGINVWGDVELPLEDEYRFVRKNFHRTWATYILLFRLLCLHNPIREIKAFYNTKKVIRESYFRDCFQYPKYDTFFSQLLQQKPLVSVVIPTLNRYEYLKDVFKDLERQTYQNFEVIVVDQSDDFKLEMYQGWKLDLIYWHQEGKALWKARNEAIKKSKGQYILLFDDDSRVEKDWIEHHIKTLKFFNADLSSGVSISKVGAEVPEHYNYFRWSDQLDTGNVLLKKEVFEKIGLFDRQFEKQRMGDGEYGLRAYLSGYRNISNPFAKRVHLKANSGGLREMGGWDAFRTKNILDPRPVPSVLYLSRKYYGDRNSLLMIIPALFPSIIPYRYKSNRVLKLLTFLLLPIFIPILGLQVILSWRQSGRKLKEGAQIDTL